MKALAQSTALAIAYISSRPVMSDDQEDEDVEILESLAAILQSASTEEIQIMEEAAIDMAVTQTDPQMKDNLSNLLRYLGLRNEV